MAGTNFFNSSNLEDECNSLARQLNAATERGMNEIKKMHPGATYRFIQPDDAKPSYQEDMERIEKKIDALNQKLVNIFGNAVLINGTWKCLSVFDGKHQKIGL